MATTRATIKTTTRPAAVAGMFYPADPQELHGMTTQYLQHAAKIEGSHDIPKAIIAPHAGYVYSGPIAASAYARLLPAHDRIKRVVLLGPSHRVTLFGLAISSVDQFDTPLGPVELDRDAINSIADLPQVHRLDEAHRMEHSLEVHLPFLLEVLDDFKLVPLVVGDAQPDEVSEVLERLWGGPETLIVISSDLSHYHDYATAQRMDSATSKAIEELQLEDIHSENACGCVPVSGLLHLARKMGLQAETIDLRNSGDTAGTKDSVVGYGAYVFL
ncbi:MAG: AmmeMemoRadiSam system protein B [Gammaproteobacteria bacterium]|nr:AmmeMemoRadiSam system protein B [Gammaproteobacteria bacterium]